MAKKCALFDNRVIQSGEISFATTKQVFLKKTKIYTPLLLTNI